MDVCNQCGTTLRQVGGVYICQNNHISQSHYVEDIEALAAIPASGFRHSQVISRKKKRTIRHRKGRLTTSEKEERARKRMLKRDMIIVNEPIYIIDFLQEVLMLQCRSLIATISLPGSHASSPDLLEQVVRGLWLLYIDHFSTASDDTSDHAKAHAEEFETQAKHVLCNAIIPVGMPSLLAILLCGCFYIRLPITYVDMYDWIIQSKIPYLSAYKMVPQFSKELFLLERIYGISGTLRPKLIPSPKKIGNLFRRCIVMYNTKIHVTFPPVQVPVILLKYANKMYLPLPIYHLALSLVSLMPDVDWHVSKAGMLSDPMYRIMAFLVVTIKIVFGFNPDSNDQRSEQTVEHHLPKLSELQAIWQEASKRHPKQDPWLEANPHSFTDNQWKSYMEFCSTQVVGSILNTKLSQFMENAINNIIEPKVNELKGSMLERVDSVDFFGLIYPDFTRSPPLVYCGDPSIDPTSRPFISWNSESKSDCVSPDYYILIEKARRVVGCQWSSMHKIVIKLEKRIKGIWGSALPKWINKTI